MATEHGPRSASASNRGCRCCEPHVSQAVWQRVLNGTANHLNPPRIQAARNQPGRVGVDDGTRTHDGRNHNPGLYQLSYVHHRREKNLPSASLYLDISPSGPSSVARPAGLEPATAGLEGRCSIRLSYGRLVAHDSSPEHPNRRPRAAASACDRWSGQRDLNPRPSAPKADALPDCAMPRRRPHRTGHAILKTAPRRVKPASGPPPSSMRQCRALGQSLTRGDGAWRRN